MTALNQYINSAIEMSPEIITRLYVGARLFPESRSAESQYESLRTLDHSKINAPKIVALIDIFPNYSLRAWITPDAQKYYIERFVHFYHINALDGECELSLLWDMLNKNYLDRELINKYLI